MKYLILPIFSLALLFACSTEKNVAETPQNLGPGEIKKKTEFDLETKFSEMEEGDSLFASIRKGFCFGTCPVYTIDIYKSGFVRYVGQQNVELKGEYTTMLNYKKMMTFIATAKEIGYIEMNDVYDNPGITDLPETTTSIVLNGKRKTIKRRYDFPRSILVYEKLFENMLLSEHWVTNQKDEIINH